MIISRGISGLAAAIALQRIGIAAAVFGMAPHITEVGAGLSLWSNAIVALRRLVWGHRLCRPYRSSCGRGRFFRPGSVYGRRFRCVGQACGRSFHLSTPRGASARQPARGVAPASNRLRFVGAKSEPKGCSSACSASVCLSLPAEPRLQQSWLGCASRNFNNLAVVGLKERPRAEPASGHDHEKSQS